jgi:hypothetical protein
MNDNLTSQARAYLTKVSEYRAAQLMRRDLLAEDTELRRYLGEVLISLDTQTALLSAATDLIDRFTAHARETRTDLEGGSS